MSREPRRIEPKAVYHLISRFVDREWYITGENERALYLKLLGKALEQSDWRCLAFAVMSNHIHLATVAGEQSLASWLRRVHSPFVNVMNRTYDRIGPMFQRGPKSILVEPDDVAHVIAYIHNNPVRARCVGSPSRSSWTSHRMYLDRARPAPWLHVSEGLARAGFSDAREFDRWVADPEREELEAKYEALIEEAPSRTSVALRASVHPQVILAAAARELGMSLEQLTSRRRTSKEQLARQVVVHCSESLGLRGIDIARALGLTQQAVSQIRLRGVTFDAQMIGTRVLDRVARRAA